MKMISSQLLRMAKSLGAVSAGITTLDTLRGGPPSTDLSYPLPGARSAITFALPLNQAYIDPYLMKKDYRSHAMDNIRTNLTASGMALDLSNFLNQIGFPSVPAAANLEYRKDDKKGYSGELPPISHRYLAVRSGVGYFGFSGNVITRSEGAAVILASVITSADLEATDPLPAQENYCDECRLCDSACASGFMNPDKKTTVALGGIDFHYSERRSYNRCDYVCGGFTGLHKSGLWSTWSPGRFPIPERDEEFLPAIVKTLKQHMKRPKEVEFYTVLIPGYTLEFTCGNCQLICHPDRETREKRYRMITESGVVIQNPNGTRKGVTPDDAASIVSSMPREIRGLYEEIYTLPQKGFPHA